MSLITIPLYAIRHQRIGGTEFAIYNLIKGLAEVGADINVIYGRKSDLSPEFHAWLRETTRTSSRAEGGLPGPSNIRFLEESLFEWRRRSDAWVIYPNYFQPLPRLRRRAASAVVLHDIQYKSLPEYHSPARRAWLNAYLPQMFEHTDRVILISDSERRLVEKHFGAKAADRCRVVWNTIDWDRFNAVEPAPAVAEMTRRPYVLAVCHQFPHKNLSTLFHAFSKLVERDKDIYLYLIGRVSTANEAFIRDHIDPSVSSRVRLLGFVSDAELGCYYRNAQLFVLPSLYEGFGMPAVEALGLGIPTLVSRTTALPEVTLGRAQYVDNPKDSDEWAYRMRFALDGGKSYTEGNLALFRSTFSPAAGGKALLDALQ